MLVDSLGRHPHVELQKAWDRLYSLNIGLHRDPSKSSFTANHIIVRLEDFASRYTEHFIMFTHCEEEAAEMERLKQAQAAGRTVKLRKIAAPLLKLEERMAMAMQEAEREVAAYDFESLGIGGSDEARMKEEHAPRPPEERYLLITPAHAYQQSMFTHDIRFHTQFELEIALRQAKLGYDALSFADILSLGGPAEQGAAKITALIDRLLSDGGPSFNRTRQAGDERLALVRRESDREEAALSASSSAQGKSKASVGLGPIDEYGGRISYSFQLDFHSRNSKAVPPDSAAWIRRDTPLDDLLADDTKPSRWARVRSGPLDEEANPFGILAREAEATGKKPTRLPFTARPQPVQMSGKSFRLARYLGSRRIITIKIPSKASAHALQELFEGTVLIVCGRPFRALWASPDGASVFAVETSDLLPRHFPARARTPTDLPLSLLHMLTRFNDLEQKPGQAMAKWGSRPQILFSDSVPIITLPASAILQAGDIVSACAGDPANPSTEEILTDGCGLMSKGLSAKVYSYLDRNVLRPPSGHPSAIQMRFGGSKGMLVVMTDQQAIRYGGADIVLRDSMIKALANPRFAGNPSMLTLDLVRWTSLKVEVGLSSEPLPIMVDRGVPRAVFLRLQQNILDELKAAFSPVPNEEIGETELEAEKRLRANVYALGGVEQDKKKRECALQGVSQRVAGLRWLDEADDDCDASTNEGASTVGSSSGEVCSGSMAYHDIDPVSGQPNSVAQCLYDALCAGFHPVHSAYAADKLRKLVQIQCDAIVTRFRLPVKQSLSAFIVPDPLGVLEPDEIFVWADGLVDPVTQRPMPYLLGPVVALRSPCKLPTDVRKMTAVFRPELTHLRNVIVMSAHSVRCRRSPASILSGGDYDGDTVQLFWAPELVEPFVNANEELAAAPPGFEEENFEREMVKGTEVLQALRGCDEEMRTRNLQSFLLAGLGGDSLTGKYSDWHGNAQYALGVSHPETIRLGRMFCHVLDARKSGLRVRPDVLKADAQSYSGDLAWRCAKKGIDPQRQNALRAVERKGSLGTYIMDELHAKGKDRVGAVLAAFPDRPSQADYEALSCRIKAIRTYCGSTTDPRRAERLAQLALVQRHVRACHDIWTMLNQGRLSPEPVVEIYYSVLNNNGVPRTPRTPRNESPTKDKAEKELGRRERLGRLRELAMVWRDQVTLADLPDLCPLGLGEAWVKEIKVSIGADTGSFRPRQLFVFDMDFITTCALSATMRGREHVTVLKDAYTGSRPSRN